MKKLIFLSLFIAFAVFGITSCQKEAVPTVPSSASENQILSTVQSLQENIPVTYFYDGISVAEGTFVPESENSNTLVLLKLDVAQRKYVEIHGFSSENTYLSYGDTHNINLRLNLEIENHLRDYAISSGAAAEYEKTGIESQSFMNYALQYIASRKPTNIAESRAPTMMREDCASGATMAFFATAPTMYLGTWSDRVGSYFPFSIFAVDTFFDKMFYKKRLATFANFGWTDYCFPSTPGLGFMNKKTSSWFQL